MYDKLSRVDRVVCCFPDTVDPMWTEMQSLLLQACVERVVSVDVLSGVRGQVDGSDDRIVEVVGGNQAAKAVEAVNLFLERVCVLSWQERVFG